MIGLVRCETMDMQYSVVRSRKRKKTISLQIDTDSRITVYAPSFTPAGEISRFVEEKRNWIAKTILRQSLQKAGHTHRQYTSGESFYYLGRAYQLEAYYDPLEDQGVTLRNECFFLNCPDDRSMRKFYFVSWYKDRAVQYISRRLEYYSSMLGLTHGGIRITSAEKRWGSCSETNRLAFSYRLVMAPPEVIDYVVVHELAHILQKNHSSKFWDLVADVLPDYRVNRRWLRDNEYRFNL